MCAFSLAAELFQVVCFHCLHSLSQPPHAGPSTPSPALRPCVGSASSLAGGANASCAPRPADPQLWTPDARVQRLPVSVRQVQLRRVLPRPCLPLSLGGSSIVPVLRPAPGVVLALHVQSSTKSCGLHLQNIVRASALSPPPRFCPDHCHGVNYNSLPYPTTFPAPVSFSPKDEICHVI